jgi:hypothetical protein
VNQIWRALRDPRVSTTLVLAVAVVVGFLLVVQGYRGTAATLYVPFQVPYLMSGVVAGLALLGAGLALLGTHLERTEASEERREVADLQRDVLRLLAAAPATRARLAERATAPRQRRRR